MENVTFSSLPMNEIEEQDSGSEELVDSYQLVVMDPNVVDTTENQRLLADYPDKKASPEVDGESSGNGNYDEALDKAGFGKFHYLLVLLCGWANASDAVEILSVSFLLPAAEKDLELTYARKGILSAIIFVGMLVGGYLWGALADINGRRRTLLFSLTTNAFFGLMSSLSQVYWLFLLMRFMSGVGVGGSIPVIFSYCGEFQPKRRRGTMISIVAMFWMSGNILTAALALAIIPSGIGFVNPVPGGFSYDSWRIFVALCTLPALTSVISFFFMPESPKFLLEVDVLIPSDQARVLHTEGEGWLENNVENVKVTVRMTAKLFRAPLTWPTLSLLMILGTLSFGYYGLWMWMPQLFLQADQGNGSVCAVDPHIVNNSDSGTTDKSIYWNSFYTSLSSLPGNLVTVFFIDIIGRKAIMSTGLLLSGVTVFFIWMVGTATEVLIVFCAFGGVSVVAWNVLNVLAVEIYPTHMRSTALGLQGIVNRLAAIIANIIFGILIQTHCAANILLVAALLVFGGLLTYTLPNTQRVNLQ